MFGYPERETRTAPISVKKTSCEASESPLVRVSKRVVHHSFDVGEELFLTISLALWPFANSFLMRVITLRYSLGFMPVWLLNTYLAWFRYSRS